MIESANNIASNSAAVRPNWLFALRFPAPEGILLIAGLALLAYLPSLNGGFIWDDSLYVSNCDLVKAPDGLYRFWFTTEPIDYWPVSNSSFWLEWRLWGMRSAGYRVTNLALHVGVALLIWVLLEELSIPGAFLAALFFTVHPVNVETVAWIAQRKGLLAMLFFLLSILCYLRAERLPLTSERNGPVDSAAKSNRVFSNRWYWLSLGAFLLALLSKGSVAFLPFVLLGIIWWKKRAFKLADIFATVPFFLLAIVLTAVNMWFQMQRSGGAIRIAGFPERLAGAGNALWFYAAKALLPIDLIFVYPLWQIRPADFQWWLPLCAAIAIAAILWRQRNSPNAPWVRSLLFAGAFFCLALLPVLGFTDVYFMKFSLVADHYQYHALVAIVAAVAAGWTVWHQRARPVVRTATTVLAIACVGGLAALTMHDCRAYWSNVTIWETTLQKNPDCIVAHNNLGVILQDADYPQEALHHFQQALRINCVDADAHHNLGTLFFTRGQINDAIDQYRQAIALNPNYPETRSNLGLALSLVGHNREAIDCYEQALKLNPTLVDTQLNLGLAFLKEGRPEEAIKQFEKSLRFRPTSVKAYANLSIAYSQTNRSAEAVSAARMALSLARDQGQIAVAQQLEAWLAERRADQASSSSGSPTGGSPSPAPNAAPFPQP